jgi:hypothetical protein
VSSNYRRGRQKEYEAMDHLRVLGYEPMRAASSHGLFDVAGVRADGAKLIQCKLTSGDFSEDENCRLFRLLEVPVNIDKELWIWQAGKGLVEIRDLKEPKFDARTEEGKTLRELARDRAKRLKGILRNIKKAA